MSERKELTMKVFVAGATGALGEHLVPQLVARGHQVTGMTRSASKQDLVRSLGARPAVADALDPEAVGQAVAAAQPDVVVHELTALRDDLDFRKVEREFELTNRLRTEGTDHLLAAARAVGAERVVAQSYAGWPYAHTDGAAKSEDDPLDPDPPRALRPALDAIRHVESAVTEADWTEGVVLRYGGFYGPATSLALDPEGAQATVIRERKFPIVGGGTGVWSFVHIADAAAATVAAIEHGRRGIYNIVDDDPAPVAEWLPAIAKAVGAKPPRRVPRWVGRLVAGEAAVVMMTDVRGASNGKAKRELGWQLRYPSWRQGFAEGLR
jgi:2-alkyl-3-oxoalkanoate reductase